MARTPMFAIKLATILAPLLLAACTTVMPMAPVMVLPGPDKDQAAFGQDDAACRQAAEASQAAQISEPEAQTPQGIYIQCMLARGNRIQPMAPPVAGPAYPYPYADLPYGNDYYGSAWLGYPIIIGGFGGYWGGYWGGGGWRHRHHWHDHRRR